jgi:putative transposase
MRLLDDKYMERPYFGVLRMTEWLKKKLKEKINPKHVRRLLRKMGLMALFPKRNLSKPAPGHKIYPYLLRGLAILRPNQVWSTDITYVRMAGGFVYLAAVMDWYSRFVLSWSLSVTMEADFCIEALKRALRRGRPEIFNSDQGSQFTSEKFTGELKRRGITISMDGGGCCFDNIFIERLWRSLKYEEIYLRDYALVPEARTGIGNWFRFYNQERPHQSLGYRTPSELYRG